MSRQAASTGGGGLHAYPSVIRESLEPERSVRLCGQWESLRARAVSGKACAHRRSVGKPARREHEVVSGKACALIVLRAASEESLTRSECVESCTLSGGKPPSSRTAERCDEL